MMVPPYPVDIVPFTTMEGSFLISTNLIFSYFIINVILDVVYVSLTQAKVIIGRSLICGNVFFGSRYMAFSH